VGGKWCQGYFLFFLGQNDPSDFISLDLPRGWAYYSENVRPRTGLGIRLAAERQGRCRVWRGPSLLDRWKSARRVA
jgi:hypothetical protein